MTYEKLKTKVEELETLIQSGSDYAQAELKSKELLAETITQEHVVLQGRILLVLSQSLWQRGMTKEALPFAEESLVIAEKAENKKLQAKCWGNIGIVLADLSDYPRALRYYNKALYAYEELDMKEDIAGVNSNIGFVYTELSDFPCALEYMGKALAVCEELGNKLGAARAISNIGMVYYQTSDYARALEYFVKALEMYKEEGKVLAAARATMNIGSVYAELLDFASALEYYGKALSVFEDAGNKESAARLISNIGLVYLDILDYSQALEYQNKALAILEQLGNKKYIAMTIGFIGKLYAIQKFEQYDAPKAEEYLLKSLAMLTELNVKHELYQNHKVLAELYENESRWTDALYHFKKFYDLEKEVQSEETQKQAQKFGYERKIAEQEKRIAIERAETQARLDEQQKLLHNVLPPIIADRLLHNETFIADSYPSVSVLFMDLVGFTRIAAIIPPRHLIYVLNTIFSNADAVMEKHGLEKIKTIGDAYMAVAGAPIAEADHATRAAHASLELLDSMNNLSINIPSELGSTSWIESVGEINVRIGLHIGEAIGGVIGDKKFSFDLWGDAVNTASRMESHGEAGKIHCSEEFKNALAETHGRASLLNAIVETQHAVSVQFIPRGEMEIKGKGMMRTYFLERI